jgi:hypothetical protein
MQQFASQLFSSMIGQGSALRLLCIKPCYYEIDWLLVARDANGHQWPEYNYTPGQLTGTIGKSEVVAVPLKAARSEFPNNGALYYMTER